MSSGWVCPVLGRVRVCVPGHKAIEATSCPQSIVSESTRGRGAPGQLFVSAHLMTSGLWE